MTKENRYDLRGVSASKEEVHEAVKRLSKGLFTDTFCGVRQHPILIDFGKICHADGVGTKSALAYLYWKLTGDMSVWRNIPQDAIVMNLDDILCTYPKLDVPLYYTANIGRNKHLIPGEVLSEIINGTADFFEKMAEFGVQIISAEGETADIGDLVRTIVIDGVMTCDVPLKDIKHINIQPGNLIVGLASDGQSFYEDTINSGMGSNGLTSSRHDLLSPIYQGIFNETYAPETPIELIYSGNHEAEEEIMGTTMGKFILSPTRSYAPIIKKIAEEQELFDAITGIIHCSGGGQTKVGKFLFGNASVTKDNLFPTPKLFKMIQEETQTPWRQMFQTFNMGHRLEIYVKDQDSADEVIKISNSFGVDAKVVGYATSRATDGPNVHICNGGVDYFY